MTSDFLIVVTCLLVGSRVGGVGLGAIAGVGLAVLVLVLRRQPGGPPVDVLLMILAVVTAAATLQAAGGLDVLVGLAERALSLYPPAITFVAPLVTYAFSFCAGTGHVDYSVLPVIAEVARRAGVRPERPMSIGVIASQQAITASPISAATAAMVGLLATNGSSLGLRDILFICVPSTVCGIMAGAASVAFRGRALADDAVYQQRLAAGLVVAPVTLGERKPASWGSLIALALFACGALSVVALGLRPDWRPLVVAPSKSEPLPMAATIQMVMLCSAGMMLLLARPVASAVVQTPIARAGLVAVVSILGISWLGNCFWTNHERAILDIVGDTVKARPYLFAFGLFALSVLLYSQAATVGALMLIGFKLGIEPRYLIAMFPAVNGYFVLPTYGTVVAAVAFDTTGTTTTGRWVFDHSFLRPGLVATTTAVAVGLLIARVAY